jgi:hypothetical protein
MWKKDMNTEEAAQIIERFLNEIYSDYPGEWGDFVDVPQENQVVERYRRRCRELDPLVNRPGIQDGAAIEELRSIIKALRSGEAQAAGGPRRDQG